jgi:DNA primase
VAIADDDIERLRSTVSIVDVVGQFVSLRRVGRNWVGLCPFHAEKTPSFNVREETGRYKCFGCDQSGDVFTFIQQHEHLDFVGAVEFLAAKAGIQLTYTSTGQSRERARRKRLIDAMGAAVEWYHRRLLDDPAARPARDYLRSRGLHGDVARTFRLGWAPDEWDVLARESGIDGELLRTTGLAFTNRRNRLQDALRARVLFPIFSDSGEAVAIGGRVLPGSADPAKYKNSPETPIYSKSRTLYGLNWAKAEIASSDEVVVCEGYTDVIGFHQAGIARAVATCGTALTEEHVRLLKRYANRVVLAFDADAAGQGAAERFYEWEHKYQVQVAVAQLPEGRDPGDLAQRDPPALVGAVGGAVPFLAFRLRRVMDGAPARTPEDRARLAERAMAVVNEHPDANVRKL